VGYGDAPSGGSSAGLPARLSQHERRYAACEKLQDWLSNPARKDWGRDFIAVVRWRLGSCGGKFGAASFETLWRRRKGLQCETFL
jgi:hypothetical protein